MKETKESKIPSNGELFSKEKSDAAFQYLEIVLSRPQAAEKVTAVASQFGLHALTVEDCLYRNVRSKFEAFPNYLFLVWHFYSRERQKVVEIHIAFGPDFFILVADDEPTSATSWREVVASGVESNFSVRDLFLTFLHYFVEKGEDYLDYLVERTETIEKGILAGLIEPNDILRLKKTIHRFDRKVCSANEMITHIPVHLNLFGEQILLFRRIRDHFLRMKQRHVELLEQSIALFDVYWGAVGIATNRQMQRLTTIATLFVPVSLWCGFFGMNFESLPFKEPWFFVVGLLIMVTSFLAVLIYIVRRGVVIEQRRKTMGIKIARETPLR